MSTATKTFEYQVRDRGGKVVTGKLEAPNQAALVVKLKEMGYAPLSVSEKKSGGLNADINLPGSNKVKLKDLAVMSRQFATMINSGLSLLRALTILAEQTESKGLKAALTGVRNDVETGQSLSVALAKHPRVFPPLMINMCRAGEVGGFLDAVLLQIAENYEAEVKLRSKIKSAMTYPVVVFVIAIIAVVGMLLFIVPVFADHVREPRRRAARARPRSWSSLSDGDEGRRADRPGRRPSSSRSCGAGSSTTSGCAR